MEDAYSRKYKFLSSYTAQKMKLRRLRQQREEILGLHVNRSDLGTSVQSGSTSDATGDAVVKLAESVEKIDRKIGDVYKALSAVTGYIERAPISETDKLILYCKFVRGLSPMRICEEIGCEYNGRAAMRKRITRIIYKLPEIKNTPSI